MPDPAIDSYNKYRNGNITRHILCSGRYLSETWLKEYEPQHDLSELLVYKRIFETPIAFVATDEKKWTEGWTTAEFYSVGGKTYLFILKEKGYGTDEKNVKIYEINPDGTPGRRIFDAKWTEGWTTAEFYSVGGKTYLFILKEKGYGTDEKNVKILHIHFPTLREYIPWMSKEREIYGGGENPLLHGGIAMATFAIEYIIKRDPSSLHYATLLLDYVEKSELVDSKGQPTGFFLRCTNILRPKKLGLHASGDEMAGLILGLYYLFIATENHPEIQTRIRKIVQRIGTFLQKNAYIIVSPELPDLNKKPIINKGWGGLYFHQWALQQAFQRITGKRYEPNRTHYNTTSDILYEIYRNYETRIKFPSDSNEAEAAQLAGVMCLWGENGHIDQSRYNKWRQALEPQIDKIDVLNVLKFLYGLENVINLTASLGLADPFDRYVINIIFQKELIECWNTENWYNHAWTIHTLHYALDKEVIDTNNNHDRALRLASVAHSMIKSMLCGERIPIPTGPLSVKVGEMDDDLYGAVVAKGLLSKYVPLGNFRCTNLPPPASGIPYEERINKTIEARDRLWDDLPASELIEVRDGSYDSPVRYHNSDSAEYAKIGTVFCWQNWRKDEKESGRILGWGDSPHVGVTGLLKNDIKEKLHKGIDVLFEGGGLDFMFSRVLMSYWWNEPLDFDDLGLQPLKAVACLPNEVNGNYGRAIC